MDFKLAAMKLLPMHPKIRVFPLIPGTKLPAIKRFSQEATRSPQKIAMWGKLYPTGNVGISTDDFAVIDVDNKEGKNGSDELLRLELEGKTLPDTLEQRTPTGGIHLFYETDEPIGNKVEIYKGIDIRGKGGYVVGAGSVLEAGFYTVAARPTPQFPLWVREKCHQAKESSPLAGKVLPGVDPERAFERARALLKDADPAIQGQGGDQHTFRLVCELKDLGLDQLTTFELLQDWNDDNIPPWSQDDLARKIQNAYQYGREAVGVRAAETQFDAVPEPVKLHPFDVLNKDYAYLIGEGSDHILQETRDENGNFHLKHLDIESFHRSLASYTMSFGEETHPVSRLWMRDKSRRSYQGLCFLPGKDAPKGFYNLWKGFAVEPLGKDEEPTVEMVRSLNAFKEHALLNVCSGEQWLCDWLMGYFAHLVQKPWELPLVALVMKGKKGVGKNALIERVGGLLGKSFAVISNRNQMTGQFNAILENKVMFVLDEAFWSGDKQAEGVLKHLVTGTHHMIERKGKDSYRVKNCLRTVIIGNEEWLVPATEDERRYAVFNVGDGRINDRSFFKNMRLDMEAGGYRYLLRYFLDLDFSKIDVTQAPETSGLVDQKRNSLSPLGQWWDDCLHAGSIAGSDFGEGWPKTVGRARLRTAFERYVKARNISGRLPNAVHFGRNLREYLPSIEGSQQRDEGEHVNVYLMPSLETARFEWSEYLGGDVEWDAE